MDTAISLSTRSLQFFLLGRRWQSDLEFFKLETNFLQRLIKEYTLDLPDSALLKIAGRNLIKLKEDSRQTDVILDAQLRQLELMAEDIIPENTAEISDIQVQLECLMVNLTKEYRAVKCEIFKLIGGIIVENNLITAKHAEISRTEMREISNQHKPLLHSELFF